MFNRIDHVEIVPGNLERTLAFYTDILGFKVQQRRKVETPALNEIVFVQLGDTMIEFLSAKNPAPLSTAPWQVGCRRIALEVADIDKAVAFLKGKGVKITEIAAAPGAPKRVEINDPDGLSIELRPTR